MPSLIEEMQRDALDRSVSATDLLRKAKLAAAKLHVELAELWIDKELNGYDDVLTLPDYRKVRGQPFVRGVYSGWMPFHLKVNAEFQEKISTAYISQSIGSIQITAQSDGEFFWRYSPGHAEIIRSALQSKDTLVEICLQINKTDLLAIVEHVRTLVLNWSIELERIGIKGDGISFAPSETAIAATHTINIGTISGFTGVIGLGNTAGDISSSTIDVNALHELSSQLESYFALLVAEGADGRTLRGRLDELEEELRKPAPQQGRLRSLLQDIRAVAINAGGGVIATGVVSLIAKIWSG
jgi:hypothetical protein